MSLARVRGRWALSELRDRVMQFLRDQRLAPGPAVVAVSGGPDSVALLCALAEESEDFGIRPLIIAHLNHRLRGQDSDDDQAFVQSVYEQLAADHPDRFLWRTHAIDVRAHRPAGESIESAARAIRYEWLASIATEWGARWVATGHTADDQAETVLHRLLRGTGVAGLAGIPERRPLAQGVEVVRPLLQVRRQEVRDYLHQHGQSFRHDSSNDDVRFTRNRIRHELLPLLERAYNPAVVDTLCRLAHQARDLHQQVEIRAAELLQRAELPRAGALLVFQSAILKEMPEHDLIDLLRFVWRRENWPERHMGFEEWRRLARVARGEISASDLPGRVRAVHGGRVVRIGPVE